MPYFDEYGPDFDMGGGNAARDFEKYRRSDDFKRSPPAGWNSEGLETGNPFGALGRLFGPRSKMPQQGPGSVQTQALPPPAGATQTGGPFGGPQNQSPPVPAKPVTQLASNHDLMKRINALMQSGDFSALLPNSDQGSFAHPDWQGMFPQGSDQAALPDFQMPNRGAGAERDAGGQRTGHWDGLGAFNPFSMGPPPAMPRIDMRGGQGGNDAAVREPWTDLFRRKARAAMAGTLFRAEGGGVPGFMRGGYPELYSRPVRHFDSGGENYVGNHYGAANGRADNVNARLSPREYVMDAESMALLGDGNPDDGAKKMDEMRVNLRKHKGKMLAKGDISPKAKAASSYIAGSPMSDGIRRAGRMKK